MAAVLIAGKAAAQNGKGDSGPQDKTFQSKPSDYKAAGFLYG